jgi:hypothetical protein
MKADYGWRINGSQDGFEQEHGRFIMEVFWFGAKHMWAWSVWARNVVDGRVDQVIVAQGRHKDLDAAKAEVLHEAADLEKEAMRKDRG